MQALTSASLAAASDAIAQRLLGARRLSWRRSCLMASFGGFWYGPANHFWTALLVALFPPPPPGAGVPAALLKLAQRVGADQLLYAPLNNGLTICFVGLVADRRPWAAVRDKVAAELPGVQRRGWRIWPLVQLVNQSVVPLEVSPRVLALRCAERVHQAPPAAGVPR